MNYLQLWPETLWLFLFFIKQQIRVIFFFVNDAEVAMATIIWWPVVDQKNHIFENTLFLLLCYSINTLYSCFSFPGMMFDPLMGHIPGNDVINDVIALSMTSSLFFTYETYVMLGIDRTEILCWFWIFE